MINTNNAVVSYLPTTQSPQTKSGSAADSGHPNDKVVRDTDISEEGQALSQSDYVYHMDTGSGSRHLDLATFFEPKQGFKSLDDLSQLLIPSMANINAIEDHVSRVFPDFLKEHGIAEAPESIRYGNDGSMILPEDYPYKDKLEKALAGSPGMENELRTLNALSSHAAALKQLEPFHYEMSQATNQAEMDAIVGKYEHLLGSNRRYPEVSLSFEKSGAVAVMADGSKLS